MYGRGGPSPLYVDMTYSRLAVYTDIGIFGVVIPTDHRVSPRILKLMDFKSDHNTIVCLGLRRAFVRNWTSACLLTYISDGLWDVSGQVKLDTSLNECAIPHCPAAAKPYMDEDSGRVVLQVSTSSLEILDYGYFYI